MQASVARCLRTPPQAARPEGLSFDLSHRLGGESDRSTIVVGNYAFRTDNGGTSPGQSHTFTRSSILFRPPVPPTTGDWWSRRVPPPGPIRLLRARLCP